MSLGKIGGWSIALATLCLLSYSPVRAATVGDTLSSLDSVTIFTKLAEECGLLETLEAGGTYTIFAPTDAAFQKLAPGTLEELRRPENRARLLAMLEYHVVPGKLGFAELDDEQVGETTLQGGVIYLEVERDLLIKVNDVPVVQADIESRNGLVHVVDEVLLLK